jgi:hypothetical protein
VDQGIDAAKNHLSDDFVCVESDGSVLNKPQFLVQAARGGVVAE